MSLATCLGRARWTPWLPPAVKLKAGVRDCIQEHGLVLAHEHVTQRYLYLNGQPVTDAGLLLSRHLSGPQWVPSSRRCRSRS